MRIHQSLLFTIALAGASVIASPAARADVRVWNYPVLADANGITDAPPLEPMIIVGARNGTFSGTVAVESANSITGLSAAIGDLSSDDGSIPADAMNVRYATSWGPLGGGPPGLDVLLEAAPDEVPVRGERALAGVWVTVSVPADAAPGVYRGELSIEVDGASSQAVPVELTVADWRAPDSVEWRTWIEMMQSPDTLAMEYDLPLWSDEHWDMIARSFQLMRPTGSRVVYVPLLRETNQGNEQSMVRWIRQEDGTFKQDYAVMEKYLDLAQEHLGDLELVVFYAWDAYLVLSFRNESYVERPTVDESATNHVQGLQRRAQQRWDKRQAGLTVTMLDEATGEVEPGHLPHYTEPESEAIWRPVFTELRERMRRRGLEDAMAMGMVTDVQPSKEEVEFLNDVSGGVPWIAHSHFRRTHNKPSPNTALHGVADITYEAHAYNLTYQVNPEEGRLHGWAVPERRAYLCRFGLLNGPALRVRQMPQLNITGQQRGVGRLGADFWSVIKDRRGRRAGQAFARYPENHWRGLNINNWFLAPGPDGPVATARLENLREGVQECEARIVLEDALRDPDRKQRLGDDLAQRAEAILDAHQRAMWKSLWTNEEHLDMMGAISGRSTHEAIWNSLSKAGVDLPGFWAGEARRMRSDENRDGIAWFVSSDWIDRNAELFKLAGEVQRRLE